MRKIDILHIVYHISIDTCLDTTKAPVQGAFVVYYRCYRPKLVTSTKRGGLPPSSFVLHALKCLQNIYFLYLLLYYTIYYYL